MNLPQLTKTKLFLLSILLTTTVIGIFFLFWTFTSNNTYQSIPSETLTTQRQQILTEIQNKLTMHSLDESKLCQKLKEKHSTIIDLNSYLQTAKSTEQLNALYQEIQKTITYLTQPPDPDPSPSPPTPLTNQWEKILWEITKFLETNPSSDKIKKWGKNKENQIGDPLTGINLKGADKSTLLRLSRGSGQSEIASKTGIEADNWKSFISLSSVGDGNCFLNSFAILLTGSQAQDTSKETPGTQQNVATRLRVALCLEIMKSYDTTNSTDQDDLKNYFVHNHKALATDHCRHMFRILKKPIVMIHKTGPNNSRITSVWYNNFFFENKPNKPNEEPFFIYHVGSYHFEPLVREVEHHQGEIYFNYQRVDFEDENNSSGKRSIVFTLKPGTLKKQNFSASQSSRLDSAGFLNKNKIRVSYSENNEEINEKFKEEKISHIDEHGIKKSNIKISINVLKADEISINGSEIIFNVKGIHGGTNFLP